MSDQEEHVFIDVEPMLIDGSVLAWQHPFIDTWYDPKDYTHDLDVYRMYLKNEDKQTIYLVFKSYIMDALIEDPGWDGLDLDKVMQSIMTSLYVMFTDDIWRPMPGGVTINNSKDFAEVCNQYKLEQFCYTESGIKLNDFFEKGFWCTFFSPDVGITDQGDGTFVWES